MSNLNFKDDRLKPYFPPEEYADALTRGSKNGGVGAIIDEIPFIKIFLARYPGDYTMIASEPSTNGFGFVSILLSLANITCHENKFLLLISVK